MTTTIKRRSLVLTERFGRSERVGVAPAVVERVRALYEAGRYLDAFEAASAAGPLQAWEGAEALEIGSRLAGNVGGDRLSQLLIVRGHRAHPDDPSIAVHYALRLAIRHGPMAAWNYAVQFERRKTVPDTHLAELLAMRATIAGEYRDFETAEALLGRAFSLAPDSPWLRVEKAAVLFFQERREEALATVDDALQAHPWFRPAVQFRGRLLHVLGRLDAAVDFLTRANQNLQSDAVLVQLLLLKRESDDDAGMLQLLDRLESVAPLASADKREWMAACRADAHYLAGDLAAAASWAEKAHEPNYDRFAARLRAPTPGSKRIRLPFRFIPQGHRTCGPATLAAIAQYWDMTVTQDEIVEAIAYDGTSDHTERTWCESHGFAAREFKVTWDAARLLLDQRVPFALATVEASTAHLQAVIGYDTVRETLFIQDPGEPHYREVPAREFLERYALTGPRGMAVVPATRRSWLEALALPEADLFDLTYAVQSALSAHRRQEAVDVLEKLEAREPGGRRALLGRHALAGFDGDAVERLRVIDRLLALVPDDQRLLNWRLQLMREIGRGEDRLALLRRAVRLEHADPFFIKELATELGMDVRNHREVGRLLWKAHRLTPADPTVLTALASWRLRMGRDEAVLDLERFAASVADKDEGLARQWFNASSAFGRGREALAWLQRRFAVYGDQSGGPAVTLAQCLLEGPNRVDEALQVIEEAVHRRPEDGDLLVTLARLQLSCGLLREAETRLAEAKGRCSPRVWRRAAAALHQRRGDRAQALKAWREVLEREPLALDAHQAVFDQLACLEGEEAALAHLEEICARFPHHYGLNELWARQLRTQGPEAAVPAARRLVENHPHDPRARLMLASFLEEMHQPEEALPLARSACEMAPDAASHTVIGKVLGALGRTDEALQELREAIRRDVNYPWAWQGFMELTSSSGERREALDFIRAEMSRQLMQGVAVQLYSRFARPVLDQGELAAQIRALWSARPDLWDTWGMLISQELDLGNREEAERLAVDSIARFPLVPAAWRDLASVQRILGNDEEALRAIRRALDLNPEWSLAWVEQGRILEESGRQQEAIEALREGVKRRPFDAELRFRLAEMIWRADSREEAWSLAATAAETDSTTAGVWESLRSWSATLRREKDLIALARSITADRPGEARSWLVLASVLPSASVEEQLTAYDAAISRSPRMAEAYDLKAVALARLGRPDEAEAVIRGGPWGAQPPGSLRGRIAWLKAVRGDLPGAIQEMSGVLEENRDFGWGWQRLAEWAQSTGDVPALRRAARELIRLAPRHPDGYCFAASADLREKKPDEAAALVVQALALDPAHAWAANSLLRYHWDRQDAAALESLPSLLLQGGATGWVSRAAGAFAAAIRNDEARLRAELTPLVCAQDRIDEVATVVQYALTHEGTRHRPVLESVLQEWVNSDRIGPSFATIWVRLQALQGRWDGWQHFGAWRTRMGVLARGPMVEYLEQAAESLDGTSAIARFTQAEGAMLREDTLLWGKVGFAFTRHGRYHDAVLWLGGATRRPDVQGWMLVNLMMAERALGREAQATEVSTIAVRRGLHDRAWNIHLAQAAFGAARRNDLQAAREFLALSQSAPAPGEWAVVRGMAEILLRVLSLSPERAAETLPGELAALEELGRAHPGRSGPLVGGYVATMEQMGRHARRWIGFWKKRYPGPRVRSSPVRRAPAFPLYWLVPAIIALSNLLRLCPMDPGPPIHAPVTPDRPISSPVVPEPPVSSPGRRLNYGPVDPGRQIRGPVGQDRQIGGPRPASGTAPAKPGTSEPPGR